jgi:PIN domain nuclease of toxin-antitoxin system
VKLLLDTHVWAWSQEDPSRLGPRTKQLLLAAEHENHVCTISTLELARLAATGAVRMAITLQDWVEQALRAIHARTVLVSHEIALEAYALPEPFHKDPANRILVAAARCHGLTLLTADERILAYRGVRARDARR